MEKILIVDQVVPVITRIKKICKKLSLETLVATSEYHAIHVFLENRSDIKIVVLDVSMNNLDGFRILEKIRRINKEINIIVLTSLNTKKYFIDCLKIGIDDFVLKPFKDDFLFSRIKYALPASKKEILSKEDIILRDYFNENYSKTLINQNKMLVILGCFYKKITNNDRQDNINLLDNDFNEKIIKIIDNKIECGCLVNRHKKQSIISIIPNIDVKEINNYKKIFNNLDINNNKFIYEVKIIPKGSERLNTYNYLIKKLEENLLKSIKYKLSNVKNIKDFKIT
ncbi:MAG: response regulator [Bacillota bacterium]